MPSCAIQHDQIPTFNLAHFNSYQVNKTDSLQYGYFENILEQTANKRLKRWAARKDYQIIGFNVINTSEDFRKGYQLKFYHKGKRLNLVRNEWAAKKTRQKASAAPLIALPFYLLELALFQSAEDKQVDEYGFSTSNNEDFITVQAMEEDNKRRQQANKDLATDMRKNDISYKTLPFGTPVYGIIIIDSKAPIDDIEVRL